MVPEVDPAALNQALARLIDPDGKRMITGIRLEAHVNQIPTLTVWEYVRPETLKDLEEIVSHYRLVSTVRQNSTDVDSPTTGDE